MIAEPYYFICKHCDKGYRGLVKFCPNCGKRLRDDSKKWCDKPEDNIVYQLSADYPKTEEYPETGAKFEAVVHEWIERFKNIPNILSE